jgi:WD40 repeat protein
VAVRTGDGVVRILDATTGGERHRWQPARVSPLLLGLYKDLLAFSPDGKLLAAAEGDEGLLWDTASWKQLGKGGVPGAQPVGVAFLPHGKVLACAVDGQVLHLWDVKTGRALGPRMGHAHPVGAVAFVPGGKALASAGIDGTVCRWDLATRREAGHFLAQEQAQPRSRMRPAYLGRYSPILWHSPVALSADGRYAATEGTFAQGGLSVWDAPSAKVWRRLKGPRWFGDAGMAFSPDGRLVAAFGRRQKEVRVWDVRAGKELRQLETGLGRTFIRSWGQAAFSADGRLLAASVLHRDLKARGYVVTIHLWSVDAGKQVWSVPAAMGEFPAVALAPDGKRLATGGPEAVVLRDAAGGHELRRLAGTGGTRCLAFSPDGRTLAGAAADAGAGAPCVSVWELATGEVRRRFTGHGGAVTCLAFSGDGALLASGSIDTTVLLWDQTGRSLAAGRPKRKAADLWADLGSARAGRAFRAVGDLVASPETALTLLRDRLRAPQGKAPGEVEIRKLIAKLDAPRYAARERATRELGRLGTRAEPALRERLRGGASPEARRRIEKLLARLTWAVPSAEELRVRRGVEVLERLATPEARRLLGQLARGAPGRLVTAEARAALDRLDRR